ncbi:MAG: transposase, partial [Eggerthellaceae bacterium]|nr:transposase [Eggerthellaceae bacterium]
MDGQTLEGKIIDMLQQRLDKEYWRANVAEQKLEELSDVQSLKDSYEQRIANRDKAIEEKDKAIERKDAEIAELKAQLEYAKRKLWGSMSEKRRVPDDPNQLKLDFGDTELTEEEKTALEQAEKEVEKQRRKITVREHTKMKPVRQKLPESLPRVMRHIYPEGYLGHEDEWTEIGTEETEHLEIIPAKAQVLVKVYHTFKRKDTGEIISPKAETEPIAKSYATASLLTEIIANKYAFHLPFYRQIEMFKSQCGIAIPQSTIEGWFAEVADLMRPAYYRLRGHVLSQDYVQADE